MYEGEGFITDDNKVEVLYMWELRRNKKIILERFWKVCLSAEAKKLKSFKGGNTFGE